MITVLVCGLLLFSVLLKNPKWKKRAFWTAFIMIFFFSNLFVANEAMRAWEMEPVAFDHVTKKYKLGIVLTGVTQGLREPSDRVYFNKGADRVTHAVQLYKLGIVEKVLISGGSGGITNTEFREADELKKAFLLMGVPESDLLIENVSRNTYESAVEVKKMVGDSIRVEQCLLITSAFHMRRSLACYRKAGMDIDTFSVDFYSHARNFYFDSLFIPQLDGIVMWQKLIKEWVGFTAYKMAGYV
jgi:uncharacterized SAM-binding protein YcdF (DUF218 family)